MKNAFKFLGLIALVAVMGFSFVACGEGQEGPQGKDGKDGKDGTDGLDGGGLLPYIPANCPLLGASETLWATQAYIEDPTTASNASAYKFVPDGKTFYSSITGGTDFTERKVVSYRTYEVGTNQVYIIEYVLPPNITSRTEIQLIGTIGNSDTITNYNGNFTYTKQ
jgi:hypothetical protein